MSLAAQLIERRAARADDYRNLIARVADDEAVDAIDAEAILEHAGKTPEQLAADVRRRIARNAIRESAGRHDELSSQLQANQQALETADAELERAAAQHQATAIPLHSEIRRLSDELREFTPDAIEKKLLDSAPHEMRERLASLQRMINQEGTGSPAVQQADRDVYHAESALRDAKRSGNSQAVAEAETRLVNQKHKQDKARDPLARLQAEYTELKQRMLNE